MKRNATGLFVAVLVLAGPARAADAPTIADVKKAWTARQNANASFRVEWVETVTIKAGAYDDLLPAGERNPGPHPPEDIVYKATCSFAADGEKAAETEERPIYSLSTKAWSLYLHAGWFDGKASMSLFPLHRLGWGRVMIDTKAKPSRLDLDSLLNKPILQVYRPRGGGAFPAFEFEKYTLSGRTQKFRGTECAEVMLKDAPKNDAVADYGSRLWCDPNRGFFPICEKQRHEGGGQDLDWDYHKDNKGQWVLKGWQSTNLSAKGAINNVVKAEVKKLELNHKFAADAFAPIPPVSSYVNVYEDGDRKEEYLLRPDGSKRRLKTAERDKDFNELSKTNADGTPYVPAKK